MRNSIFCKSAERIVRNQICDGAGLKSEKRKRISSKSTIQEKRYHFHNLRKESQEASKLIYKQQLEES